MAILTDENYVDKAERAISLLEKDNKGNYLLTTSQIRNLLSLCSSLYDRSKERKFDELINDVSYLRVQFVYQAGREIAVKDLVEKAQILDALKEIKDRETLQRFCRYMEALVAYFKFYGGKD